MRKRMKTNRGYSEDIPTELERAMNNAGCFDDMWKKAYWTEAAIKEIRELRRQGAQMEKTIEKLGAASGT